MPNKSKLQNPNNQDTTNSQYQKPNSQIDKRLIWIASVPLEAETRNDILGRAIWVCILGIDYSPFCLDFTLPKT